MAGQNQTARDGLAHRVVSESRGYVGIDQSQADDIGHQSKAIAGDPSVDEILIGIQRIGCKHPHSQRSQKFSFAGVGLRATFGIDFDVLTLLAFDGGHLAVNTLHRSRWELYLPEGKAQFSILAKLSGWLGLGHVPKKPRTRRQQYMLARGIHVRLGQDGLHRRALFAGRGANACGQARFNVACRNMSIGRSNRQRRSSLEIRYGKRRGQFSIKLRAEPDVLGMIEHLAVQQPQGPLRLMVVLMDIQGMFCAFKLGMDCRADSLPV